MKRLIYLLIAVAAIATALCCERNVDPETLPKAIVVSAKIDGKATLESGNVNGVSLQPQIVLSFSRDITLDEVSLATCLSFTGGQLDVRLDESDHSLMIITPASALGEFTKYSFAIFAGEGFGVNLVEGFSFSFVTALDDTVDVFPRISTDELLTKVQERTFAYFWDYAHPVSGLARERLGSGETVTTGGSGFGLMAIPVGISRGFITRQEGAERALKIVNFLKDKAVTYHGAFPHWINGTTGATIAFSTYDNGADLVETAFLMEGLLTLRAFFDGSDDTEAAIRSGITSLWEAVEWDHFTRSGQDVLYWHWSPDYDWKMNMQVRGWNEALIVYVLAASSPTHPISKEVYDKGWASGTRNHRQFYDITLPLGPNYGGPLFFAHYSFLGLDPRNLKDVYADYWVQNTAHARINHAYCAANPKGNYGYSDVCWGLTASDYWNGYTASSPTNDTGTIAPTAALSSIPYTPEESIAALEYFYYKLGSRIWGDYGFYDAFSLEHQWFAKSYIAIDQGPIVCMIENYRSGLLWDTFMRDADVLHGLDILGFSY
ncbi:MAG: beta-glucosidase [Bacteroidales bacterium]|nr:beta-glucosidase [Bacteroidales bacterium]MBQ9529522.1 beta-glucosidase [Bacteroidales bacterium]